MSNGGNQLELNRPRLIAFALALITLLVYLPVCFHDWIFFDDPAYVLDNPVVQRGISLAGIKWVFVGWHASNWHPLTWLSHMLDCQLFGLNPGAQHFVNVLFHAANSALVFALWHRLTKAVWPSAMVAALFAWHPLHVESVAWIAERKDVLSTLFGLLALVAYLKYLEEFKVQGSKFKVEYGCALGCFALGLMAKPMLVTLPFVMLLLDFWPLGRWQVFASATGSPNPRITEHGTRNTLQLLLEKLPFFALSAVSCVITFLAQRSQAVVSLKQYSFGLRMENVVVSYGCYLLKTFWPVKLAVFYPLPEMIPAGAVVLAAMVLIVISAVGWRWRKSNPSVLMGWLWFLGTLVPVIGWVQVGEQAMADRYMYLPSIGLFVAMVFGVAGGLASVRLSAAMARSAAVVILAGCVAGTEFQLQFWRDTRTLFQRTLAVTQKNGPAHMMLGVWFERQGNEAEALKEYQRGLECDSSLMVQVAGGEKRPLAAHVELLLGQAAERERRSDEALGHYRAALKLDGALVEAYNNLGNLLDEMNKPDEALASYQEAVRLRPDSPVVHENFGTELVKLNRFDEGLREYDEAARLAPGEARPFYLTGKAWLRRGEGAKAGVAFQAGLEREPDDVQTLVYLARVLASDANAQVRDGARAVSLAEKANALTGGKQPFVLGTLAMACAEAGRFDAARQSARAALQLAGTNSTMASDLQMQLRLYEGNRAFREGGTNTKAR
jgi:tetratricopeptide (TPR) repeat protein